MTSSPEDSTSFVDTATSSGSIDDVPSPDPLEMVSEDSSDFAVLEASVSFDDSSSSGLNILGMSLLLEYSKQIHTCKVVKCWFSIFYQNLNVVAIYFQQ